MNEKMVLSVGILALLLLIAVVYSILGNWFVNTLNRYKNEYQSRKNNKKTS